MRSPLWAKPSTDDEVPGSLGVALLEAGQTVVQVWTALGIHLCEDLIKRVLTIPLVFLDLLTAPLWHVPGGVGLQRHTPGCGTNVQSGRDRCLSPVPWDHPRAGGCVIPSFVPLILPYAPFSLPYPCLMLPYPPLCSLNLALSSLILPYPCLILTYPCLILA